MLPHPPLILPSIGRGQESAIQSTIDSYTACAKQIADLHPDTIIITSPHALCYRDYFHISPGLSASGSFAQFRSPEEKIDVTYDEELVREISRACAGWGMTSGGTPGAKPIPAGTDGERWDYKSLDHGTMIPLYFVNKFYTDYRVVRIGLSGLSFKTHWDFGRAIREAVTSLGRRCVFIASGDLSHKLKADGPYGFDAAGSVYDERIMRDMGDGNFSSLLDYDEDFTEQAAQCGHRSFLVMGGAIDGEGLEPKRLSYEGPFGVGYGVCAYGAINN